MNLLIKKTNRIFPVLMTAFLMLVMGHFCLQNTANAETQHSETQHSHSTTTALSENNIEDCCQGNDSIDPHSAIRQKSTNTIALDAFTKTIFSNTKPDFYYSEQLLPSTDISPHQFLANSFRVLLC